MKPIHSFILSLSACLCLLPAMAQETPPANNPMAQWNTVFDKLPQDEKTKYANLYDEACRAQAHQRTTDALVALEQMERICPNNASIISLIGSCYTDLRNAEKAIAYFKRAIELNPTDFSTAFNLGEIYFVSHQYEKSVKFFEELIPVMQKNKIDENIIDLIHLKLFIAYTKLGNKEKAEQLANYRTENDDTPYYYFVQTIKYKEANDLVNGQLNLNAARKIYADVPSFPSYIDAMQESGYIDSLDKSTMINVPGQ